MNFWNSEKSWPFKVAGSVILTALIVSLILQFIGQPMLRSVYASAPLDLGTKTCKHATIRIYERNGYLCGTCGSCGEPVRLVREWPDVPATIQNIDKFTK